MKAPFPIQPELTGIAIAYQNGRYIADEVLPRVGVGTQEYKYMVYSKEDRFTIPNTTVGRTGKPNQVEFGATEMTSSTKDRALDDPIPQADLDNAPKNFDPRGNAVEGIMDLIAMDRELRVANMVFNEATYPVGNKIQLAGTDQWNDFANSDPIAVIMAALDAPMMRPNVMVIGHGAFTVLRHHPLIAKGVNGNSGDVAIAARRDIAALFELEDVLVGESFYNGSKPGQSFVRAEMWGKHCALIHRNRAANTRKGVTFGLTAQWGDRVAGSQIDGDIGMRGGERVRAGESVDENIVAADVAYFIEDAVG